MSRRGVLGYRAQRNWERGTIARKTEKAVRKIQAGKMSINDARAALGLMPFDLPECDMKASPGMREETEEDEVDGSR